MTLRVLSLPRIANAPSVLPVDDSQADSTMMKSKAFSKVLKYEVGPFATNPYAIILNEVSNVKMMVEYKSSFFKNYWKLPSGSYVGFWKHSENVDIRITMITKPSNRSS